MKKFSRYFLLLTLPLIFYFKGEAQGYAVPNINKLVESNGITEVYLSGAMLKTSSLQLSKNSDMPPVFATLIRSVSSIRIFMAEDKQDINLMKEVFNPLRCCRVRGSERLMSIKQKQSAINLVGVMDGNVSNGLYLFIDSPNNTVAIMFGGTFTKEQLNEMFAQEHSAKKNKMKDEKDYPCRNRLMLYNRIK